MQQPGCCMLIPLHPARSIYTLKVAVYATTALSNNTDAHKRKQAETSCNKLFAVLVHEAALAAQPARHHTTHWLLACSHAPKCNLYAPSSNASQPAHHATSKASRMATQHQTAASRVCKMHPLPISTAYLVMHSRASTTGCIILHRHNRSTRALPASIPHSRQALAGVATTSASPAGDEAVCLVHGAAHSGQAAHHTTRCRPQQAQQAACKPCAQAAT